MALRRRQPEPARSTSLPVFQNTVPLAFFPASPVRASQRTARRLREPGQPRSTSLLAFCPAVGVRQRQHVALRRREPQPAQRLACCPAVSVHQRQQMAQRPGQPELPSLEHFHQSSMANTSCTPDQHSRRACPRAQSHGRKEPHLWLTTFPFQHHSGRPAGVAAHWSRALPAPGRHTRTTPFAKPKNCHPATQRPPRPWAPSKRPTDRPRHGTA